MSADQDSFVAWATTCQARLLRVATLLTGDHHRAEDLVQEALVKVAARWQRLHDGSPEAYARRVIVRDNISWWRRQRREVVGPYDVEVTAPAPAPERHLLLRQALGRLTPRQRAVIVLRYYEDLTEAQAADVMGVSVGTVKSQTHLALRRLRERAPELAELLAEEPPP